MPREDRFFDRFTATPRLAGAEAVQGLLPGGERVPHECRKGAGSSSSGNEGADGIAREVLPAVRRSSITPSTAAT